MIYTKEESRLNTKESIKTVTLRRVKTVESQKSLMRKFEFSWHLEEGAH